MEETKNISFCKFSGEEINCIRTVLSNIFKISGWDKILKAYTTFSNDFKSEERPELVSFERIKAIPKTAEKRFVEKFLDASFMVGIDLPTLLKPVNYLNEGTVFIVAEDPLRNFHNENISLSTPFGTHIKECRLKSKNIYWDITKYLLDNGYSVYQTDIYKLWLKHPQHSKERFPRDIFTNFKQALISEISFFDPKIVITYGNNPARFLKLLNIDGNIRTISIPHPAPTANGKWSKILGKGNCSSANKSHFIRSQIKEILDHL